MVENFIDVGSQPITKQSDRIAQAGELRYGIGLTDRELTQLVSSQVGQGVTSERSSVSSTTNGHV